MTRNPNTTRSGSAFDFLTRQAVWNKSRIIPGYHAGIFRMDVCGKTMMWSDYGNVNSKFGWEIDHIYPVAHGGSDVVANLQPLQWQDNRSKGDTIGRWVCAA